MIATPLHTARAVIAVALLAPLLGCEEVSSSVVGGDLGDGPPPAFVAVAPPAGAEDTNFFAIAGSAADDVVLVGSGGTIVRWDGMKLALEASGTREDLRSVVVVSRDLAWAAGANGTLLRWKDRTWTAMPSGLPSLDKAYFNAVWADDKSAVAVGVKGAGVAWDGTFHAITPASPDDLFSLARSGSGLFAVGTLGTVAEYDAKNFTFNRRAIPGYSKTLTAVTIGRNGSWLVGLGGAIYHRGGGDLTDPGGLDAVSGLPSVFVRAVAAPGQGAWVVGFDGLVGRAMGSKAATLSGVPDRWYEAVWGVSDEDLWIAGNAGTILRTNHAGEDGGDAGGPSDGGSRG